MTSATPSNLIKPTLGAAKPEVAAKAASRARRPMNAPTRRLESSGIEGFHLHWIRESNLSRAQQAGYNFVKIDEVEVNHRNVSVPSEMGSTSDLSDRVSVQYGGDTLFLMKLEEALFREDMAAIGERNQEIWQQIFRGEQIAGTSQQTPGDTSHRYVKEATATGADLTRAQRGKIPLFARKFK